MVRKKKDTLAQSPEQMTRGGIFILLTKRKRELNGLMNKLRSQALIIDNLDDAIRIGELAKEIKELRKTQHTIGK